MMAALPGPETDAEFRADCKAEESSVVPSHFIPVANTGLMMIRGFALLG
jgi:hypothetical protein